MASWKAFGLALATSAIVALPIAADANDRVRLIVSTKMPFEMYAPNQALAEGYFKEEKLDVSIIYSDGGAATLQTIITGSQEVTNGVGVLSVISAFAKGAPLVILGNTKRGIGDTAWYVKADSPIKSFKDIGDKELVYSRNGTTSHLGVLDIKKTLGLDSAKLVSVGGMAASRTQVMTGQVATGWMTPPAGLDLLRRGEIRIIGTGDEAAGLRGATIRVYAANSEWVKKNRDVAARFMKAMWRGLEFQYKGGDRAIERYAKEWGMDVADARRGPDFVKWDEVSFSPIGELDRLIQIALDTQQIREPLTNEQKKQLIDYVWLPPGAQR